MSYEQLQLEAIKAIEHSTDGPVTDFVLIARAIKLAREQSDKFPVVGIDDPIANALWSCLEPKTEGFSVDEFNIDEFNTLLND